MRTASTDDMLSTLVVGGQEPGFPRGFGKFELLERVGTGGMAEVFRALLRGAEGFEKEVCIKRILPMFTEDDDFVRMFKDEATLASKLQHANIVQILDFDTAEGQYYIAMEFVEGRDLKRVLSAIKGSGRTMPLGIGAFIGAEILKGLHYAHTRWHSGQALGIIHRDISPHNVLVSMFGEVKITDFGIAKAASRVSATRSGVVKGKILYMSPEQAAGGTIDHRADLFAAGVVLYEVLTGQRPFAADTDAESLAKIARGSFTPPRDVRPDLPEKLDAVVCKLMAREPSQRYGSGAEALRDLGAEAPPDGAMQLGELMSALIEGPVAVSRRVATQVLPSDKPLPKAAAIAAPVVPADSAAVTRTRGPREEPEAIAFLDTQVATATAPASEERPSLGSEFVGSVPTVVSGPPEMLDALSIPPTAIHTSTDLAQAHAALAEADRAASATSPAPGSGITARETPSTRGATPPPAGVPVLLDSTPAAWSFAAEATGTGRRTRAGSRAPVAALVAAVAIAIVIGGYLLSQNGGGSGAGVGPSQHGVAPPVVGPIGLPPLPQPPGSAPVEPAPVQEAVAPVDNAPSGEPDTAPAHPAAPAGVADGAQARPGRAKTTRPPRGKVGQAAQGPQQPPAPAPAPPPARPAEPQGTATLVINAQPWAHVKVNGRSVGDTPVGPIRVPAGTVRILLEREGRSPVSRSVTVVPGEERSLSYPFQ